MSIKIEPEAYPYLIVIGLVFLAFVLLIAAIMKNGKKRVKKQEDIKKQMSEAGINYQYVLPALSGLNIPEKTMCKVSSTVEGISVEANNMKYILKKEKIQDVCTTTDTEISKQYVSSVGGAIGGTILFGPIGGMIGGRVKEKTDRTIYTYMIITYIKDDEPNYIAFDVTYYKAAAKKFVAEYKNATSQTVIEL